MGLVPLVRSGCYIFVFCDVPRALVERRRGQGGEHSDMKVKRRMKRTKEETKKERKKQTNNYKLHSV